MEDCCDNCGLNVADDTKSTEELLTEFISTQDGMEISISVQKAFNTVFQHAIKSEKSKEESVVCFCNQCTMILAELYKFYCEFIKLSKQTSTVQKILNSSLLLQDGNNGRGTAEIATPLQVTPRQRGRPPRVCRSRRPITTSISSSTLKCPVLRPSPEFPAAVIKEEPQDDNFSQSNDDDNDRVSSHSNHSLNLSSDFIDQFVCGFEFPEYPEVEVKSSLDIVEGEQSAYSSSSISTAETQPTIKRRCSTTNKPRIESTEQSNIKLKPTNIGATSRHSLARRIQPNIKKTKSKLKRTVFGKYKCFDCNQTFNSSLESKNHRRKFHLPDLPCIVAPNCTAIFKFRTHLNWHQIVEHGIGEKLADRECKTCGKYFQLPTLLTRHIKCVHTNISKEEQIKEKVQITCEYCGKTYRTFGGYSLHVNQYHLNQQTYVCPICKKTSIRDGWLTEHLPIHDQTREKKFNCTKCELMFYTKKRLQRHEMIHKRAEAGIKSYVCKTCGDRFSQCTGLRRHVLAKHSEVGPFVCEVCGKEFKIKEYLQQHMRSKTHGGRGHGLYGVQGKHRREKLKAAVQEQQGTIAPAKDILEKAQADLPIPTLTSIS